MSNLSDRVMNMKFMKKTDTDGKGGNKEEQLKKIKDTSEWVLPNAAKLRARSQPSNVVQSIGYASINSISGVENDDDEVDGQPLPVNAGRRKWGEPETEKGSDLDITKLKDSIPKKSEKSTKKLDCKIQENNVVDHEAELDTKDFLESLWNKSKTHSKKGSNKRKTDKKEDHVPDIKNKRKRLTDT